MIHSHRNAFNIPESQVNISNVPLLDDAFDPDEEEIFDHTELFSLRVGEHQEEDFSIFG